MPPFLSYSLRILVVFALLAGVCRAQEPFPGEPASPPSSGQPSQQQQPQQRAPANLPPPIIADDQFATPTLHVNTNIVLVPTLVEKKSGDVLYGLQPKDFLLTDNGVPQTVHVDEDMDSQPVSLVICMERGRDAAMEFDKFARLGPLLQMFTGEGQGEVALVVFDSRPTYLEAFQKDTSYIEQDLDNLPPGDGGAAIVDAVGYSVNLLEQRPADHRRVLLLISETRDHGSRHVTIPQLVQQIGTTNTLVFSLAFAPSKSEMREWAKGHGGMGNDINVLAPVIMTMNAMRRNTPKTLASMSGGEYSTFARDKSFEDHIAEVASHARNRYMLSFHPTDLTPGLHDLKVSLTQDYGARIVSRESYWAVNDAAKTP